LYNYYIVAVVGLVAADVAVVHLVVDVPLRSSSSASPTHLLREYEPDYGIASEGAALDQHDCDAL